LALDIGLACFSLGVEGIKGQVEIMLGRLARVDCAALPFWRLSLFHGAPSILGPAATEERRPPGRAGGSAATAEVADASSLFARSPKKRGPFQLTPVIV